MLIRKAKQSDTERLTVLANRMVKNTPFTAISKERIEKVLTVPTAVVFVAESKEIVGFICGMIHDQFFTQQKFASDLALYVDESHRGSSAALRLIKNFEIWAKENKAEKVWLGQSVGQNIESTTDFYKRLGYKVVGVNTYKEIKE
jgi:ribosomal protein S18 acetylase RimI-like enzyme